MIKRPPLVAIQNKGEAVQEVQKPHTNRDEWSHTTTSHFTIVGNRKFL